MINQSSRVRRIPAFIMLLFFALAGMVCGGPQSVFADEINGAELDEVVNFEIFPYSEYEKLEKLKEQAGCENWSDSVAQQLKIVIYQLVNTPGEARAAMTGLERLLATPPASETVSIFDGGEGFTAKNVAGDLTNRLAVWEAVLSLLEREPAERPFGVVPQMRVEDADRLYAKSDMIRNSLLTSQNGQHWVRFFQLTPLHGQLGRILTARNRGTHGLAEPMQKYANEYVVDNIGEITETVSTEIDPVLLSEAECRRISQLANHIFLVRECTALTPEQSQLLESPLVREWLAELEPWRSDPVHPLDLLAAYECYRQYRGTSDGSRLSVMSRRMLASRSRELQAFAQAVQNEFSHAHLKVYVSKYLINTLLPKLEPEFDAVRENVAGQQVVGRRRADTRMHITLIPDPNRLLMSLNINGQVVTQTTASTFPATLHNQSFGTYSATKPLELTSRGVVTGPANVTANSRVKLNNVETDLDIVPIVSDLIREIAKEQYSNQEQQIQADARAKVVAQAKQRIDSEADAGFRGLNERLDRLFFNVLRQREAGFEQHEAKTTEEWLLTSWYLSTPCSLGSDSKEPATPPGTVADLKVHESGVKAALERFELAGKQMTLGELKRYLVTVIGQPGTEIPEEENDHVIVAFAESNPVGVRFLQDRVELSLNLKRLQVENRAWDDFCVIAAYEPDVSTDGSPCLKLRGSVQLDGQLTLMQQVALRTIFSKIFLQMESIPLRPKLFDTDARFAELATGCVRIENGWFAIALLPQEIPAAPQQKQPVFVQETQPRVITPPQNPTQNSTSRQLHQPTSQRQSSSRSVMLQAVQPGSAVRR